MKNTYGQNGNSNGSNGNGNGGSKVWPSAPKAVVPESVVKKHDNSVMQTQSRVYIPVLNSEVISMTSVLTIQHVQGDVTVLDVFAPTEKVAKSGKAFAMSEPIELSQQRLGRGESYVIVGVYNLASGIAFQRFGVSFESKLVRLDHAPTQTFPMIRSARHGHLRLLADRTGLDFQVNLQIKWKQYSAMPESYSQDSMVTRKEAAEWTAFNAREAQSFSEAMDAFADVEVGTPLEVARQLIAARLASQGESDVDLTSPTFGFARTEDVVERVAPAFGFSRATVNA